MCTILPEKQYMRTELQLIALHNKLAKEGVSLVTMFSGPAQLSRWLNATRALCKAKPEAFFEDSEEAQKLREKHNFEMDKRSYIQHADSCLCFCTPRVTHNKDLNWNADFKGPKGPEHQVDDFQLRFASVKINTFEMEVCTISPFTNDPIRCYMVPILGSFYFWSLLSSVSQITYFQNINYV